MNRPDSRREFLRGLTTLPLIGGSVALIGNPSAVASPLTHDLMLNYETWLSCEQHALSRELRPGGPAGALSSLYTPAWDWHMQHMDGDRPSSRAALILSTVGCGWGPAR